MSLSKGGVHAIMMENRNEYAPVQKKEQPTSPTKDTTYLDSIAAQISPANTLFGRDRLDSVRFLIWNAVFALVGFFLWAAWVEIDQITRTQGTVIASSPIS